MTRRHRRCDGPRPRHVARREPDPGLHGVIRVRIHLDERQVGVHDVRERGAVDLPVLRRPVELRRERRSIVERNRGRLRNRCRDDCFLRLRRAGDRCKDDSGRRVRRDLCERGGQRIVRDIAPGPGQRSGREPPPGEQHEVLVVRSVDEDVGGRVVCPEQARAGDRSEIRLAGEHDQLGRVVRDIDGRRAAGERQPLLRVRAAVEKVHRAGLRELRGCRVQARGRVARDLPRPIHGVGLHPAVIDVQVVRRLRAVPQYQCARVDDPLQLRAAHRLPGRVTVHGDEQSRRVADDDVRRIVLHGHAVRAHGLRRAERGHDEVERHFTGRIRRIELPEVAQHLRAAIGHRGEVGPLQQQVVEDDHARDLVDFRARHAPDDAECLAGHAVGRDAHRGAELQVIVLPLAHLRHVDRGESVRERHLLRPRSRCGLRGRRRRVLGDHRRRPRAAERKDARDDQRTDGCFH